MADTVGENRNEHRGAPPPLISVVVCTRNRGKTLEDTLRRYERIEIEVPWELVIVNNGSTDTTAEVLQSFSRSTTLPLRVLDEPRPGACRARNTGWRGARSDIIVFTDDDCYPATDFVAAAYRIFSTRPIGFVGGRILLHDPQDYPITIQPREEPLDIPAHTFIESGFIHSANLTVRRQALEALGGFDEMFGAGTRLPAGEDTDLINRASAAGFAGAYDPAPLVYHHHRRRTQQQVDALIRGYDIGRGAYFMKAVLDARRRQEVSRQWYWRTVLPFLTSRRAALKLVYELRGALGYCLLRARRRFGLSV